MATIHDSDHKLLLQIEQNLSAKKSHNLKGKSTLTSAPMTSDNNEKKKNTMNRSPEKAK
jgi:hypothetical protein